MRDIGMARRRVHICDTSNGYSRPSRPSGSTRKRSSFIAKPTTCHRRTMQHTISTFRSRETSTGLIPRARVLYTLGTAFALPPQAQLLLETSIQLYKHAVSLTQSPLLVMDVGYNLAEALVSLADLLEDIQARDEAGVRALREEATIVLGRVLDGQEDYLTAMQEEQEQGDQQDIAVDPTDASAAPTAAADETVEAVEGGAEHDQPATTTEEEGMEVDEGSEEQEGPYETFLPTASTLVDTLLSLISLQLTLWSSVTPSQTPSEEAQVALRQMIDRVAPLVPASRQAEIDLAEIRILLTVDGLVWDMYHAEARPGAGAEKSLEGAVMALTSLFVSLDVQPPEDATVRADVLVTLAETHLAIVRRVTSVATQLPEGPSPVGQQGWWHTGTAVDTLQTALDLPRSAATPRGFQSSVLLQMSVASIERARLARINETAKRNAKQLVDNALTYSARAADALGWKGFISATPSIPAGVEVPYPSGWDNESLAQTILLTHLGALLLAVNGDLLLEGDRQPYEKRIDGVLGQLRRVGESEENAGRRIRLAEVERYIRDLEEEEPIGEDEKGWWAGVIWAFTD